MLTAEEFDAQRFELPEGGRWTELHAGEIVTLSPPNDDHGTVVMNLSKALANAIRPDSGIYACFGLGLIVERRPDSVFLPPISLYASGPIFAESDKGVSDQPPVFIAEVASTNDRRRNLAARLTRWLSWGVREVAVFDTHAKIVHVHRRGATSVTLQGEELFCGAPLLPGLELKVVDIFKPPTWWKKSP